MVDKTENIVVNKTAKDPTQRTVLDVIPSSDAFPTRRVHLAVCPLPGEEWSSEDIEVHQLQHAARRCAARRAGKGRGLRQQGLEGKVVAVCREAEEEGQVEAEEGEERGT